MSSFMEFTGSAVEVMTIEGVFQSPVIGVRSRFQSKLFDFDWKDLTMMALGVAPSRV